jgi:exopolysaccharide biosynthesis polyprenyl glycosylphosphotransferase
VKVGRARILRSTLWLTDGLCTAAAIGLSLLVHSWLLEWELLRALGLVQALGGSRPVLVWLGTALLSWTLVSIRGGVDRALETLPSPGRHAALLARAHLVALGLQLAALWFSQAPVNRSLVIIFAQLVFWLQLALRVLLVARMRKAVERSGRPVRVAFVGSGQDLASAEEELARAAPTHGLVGQVVVSVHPEPSPVELERAHEELERLLHELPVDVVLFVSSWAARRGGEPLVAVVEERGQLPAHWLPEQRGTAARPRLVELDGVLAYSHAPEPSSALARAVKQVLDILLAALLFVTLLPLMLSVAALLLLLDGRPVFFSQERIGLNGRRFRMHKFRTMVRDAEARRVDVQEHNEAGGPVFKMRGDPRVTALGRLLRRTSIDELPQLYNVLVGEMSLVGPRPLESGEQQRIHGSYRRRLSMKPGITGLWQISGRSDVSFERWMQLDLRYVDRWSLGLDLLILLRTIPAVLLGRGAR